MVVREGTPLPGRGWKTGTIMKGRGKSTIKGGTVKASEPKYTKSLIGHE